MSPKHLLAAACTACLVAIAPSNAAAAQAAGPAATASRPDFTGTWERYPQPGETPDPRYVSPPAPPPALKPKQMAEWKVQQAKLAARQKEGQPAGDDYVRCIPDGMPAMMMGMFPMEIIQLPNQINITQEAFNQTRRIYMNEKLPPASELDPSFYGRSVGRWEGDTLVIETTGIKERVKYLWVPHSENMKITERLHMIGPDILRNDITVEDDYLEKPWTFSFTYRRLPGYKMLEYVCEDNREYVDEKGMHRLRVD